MVFESSLFCPKCGTPTKRAILKNCGKPCPKCAATGSNPEGVLSIVQVGNHQLIECEKCFGLWIDAESLEKISSDAEHRAAVLGSSKFSSVSNPVQNRIEAVRYYRCPECQTLMNRVNYANYSGVIVDVCKGHGTWFDKDELRRVMEFINRGGISMAKRREIENLQEKRRRSSSQQMSSYSVPSTTSFHDVSIFEALGDVAFSVLK